jgi:hypothetical protein
VTGDTLLRDPAMTQRGPPVSPTGKTARVVAGQTKNESTAISESTGGICRFGGGAGGRADRIDAVKSSGAGPIAISAADRG